MLAVANRLKCEVHFATSALTKPSFQPLKILYIQQEPLSPCPLGLAPYFTGQHRQPVVDSTTAVHGPWGSEPS